jgi:hypothetical protein
MVGGRANWARWTADSGRCTVGGLVAQHARARAFGRGRAQELSVPLCITYLASYTARVGHNTVPCRRWSDVRLAEHSKQHYKRAAPTCSNPYCTST